MTRIILILPCCIGDVVLATATLKALRRAYPSMHITWAVGSWSKPAIENHDLLDAILDTGDSALPVRSLGGMLRFVWQLRAGKYSLMVSLARSPLMSVAALLSGIPVRAGLDSNGRGFGYTVRAPIRPDESRSEADIYLDVARALELDVSDCYANVPVHDADVGAVREKLAAAQIQTPYIVINPAGGQNPGMVMDVKRYPPENFAQLANRLAEKYGAAVVLIGGPNDGLLIESMATRLKQTPVSFAGTLTFGEIAALARDARVYIGNDTGLTHLAAAAGAKTVMILGPTDPKRYAPFVPDALALWQPSQVGAGGVAGGVPDDWNWARDGIPVDEAERRIIEYLDKPLS
jgi:ADP-heptose:LPS heptosyltransferase